MISFNIFKMKIKDFISHISSSLKFTTYFFRSNNFEINPKRTALSKKEQRKTIKILNRSKKVGSYNTY